MKFLWQQDMVTSSAEVENGCILMHCDAPRADGDVTSFLLSSDLCPFKTLHYHGVVGDC